MRKVFFTGLILLIALSISAIADDARMGEGYPVYSNPFMPERPIDYSHSFAPMDIDTTPPFPAYHGLPVRAVGVSYYDMQHNTTKGRNIAVDTEGGVHITWMNALDEGFSNRRVYYNYKSAESDNFECSDSTGVRVDNRTYAGYSNISLDDETTVPTVAYHDRGGSPSYGTNISYDGTYYATSGDSRCGFISPAEIPMPWAPSELDLQAIWPKIAQIDTTIFMVSTPSTSDTTIGGIYYGQSVIYYRGFISPAWGGFTEAVFDIPVEMEDNQIGITCDITAYADGPEVTMAYVRHDTSVSNDTCYCEEANFYTTIFDAAALMLRRSTDMGATWSDRELVTQPGLHIYSDYPDTLYLGWYLDTMFTPPETVEVYRPVYSRPIDVNISYSTDGVLHAVWTGAILTAHEGWEFSCEASCSVGAYCQSIIYHWDDDRDEIDTVLFDPIWRGAGCPEESGITHIGYSYEPQVAISEDGVVFVFWEQMASEYMWVGEDDTFYLDVSETGFQNSEIWGACYDPMDGNWSDPLLITNTYSTGCAAGECMSEIEVTVAERVDDYIHLSFVLDTDAGLFPYEEGSASLARVKYLALPTDETVTAMYAGTQIASSIDEEVFQPVNMPESFRLGSNYPNPFNAATTFWFDVYEPGRFAINVIDVNGRIVSRLANKELGEGRHRFVWEGKSDNGWVVPSGVYFLRASDADGNEFTRKITLMK